MTWKTLQESSDTKSSRKNLKNIMETTASIALTTSKIESHTILLWLKMNFCRRISFKPWINSTGGLCLQSFTWLRISKTTELSKFA
jgi:hypothetical protein